MATLISFMAAALASSHKFCYSAIASSAVVLILPVRQSLLCACCVLTLARVSSFYLEHWRSCHVTSSLDPSVSVTPSFIPYFWGSA